MSISGGQWTLTARYFERWRSSEERSCKYVHQQSTQRVVNELRYNEAQCVYKTINATNSFCVVWIHIPTISGMDGMLSKQTLSQSRAIIDTKTNIQIAIGVCHSFNLHFCTGITSNKYNIIPWSQSTQSIYCCNFTTIYIINTTLSLDHNLHSQYNIIPSSSTWSIQQCP